NVDTCPLRLLRRRRRCWWWGWGWGWGWLAVEAGQHDFSRRIVRCGYKRAVASSSHDVIVYGICVTLEWFHCLLDDCAPAAEGYCEVHTGSIGLGVDEVPDAHPIARVAEAVGQIRRTRRSHQLKIRYYDQGKHGQQQLEDSVSFHDGS